MSANMSHHRLPAMALIQMAFKSCKRHTHVLYYPVSEGPSIDLSRKIKGTLFAG